MSSRRPEDRLVNDLVRVAKSHRDPKTIGWYLDRLAETTITYRRADVQYHNRQRASAKAGVAAKRKDWSRSTQALRAGVAALRATHPQRSTRAIARLLLPPDQRSDKRAIETMAARLRRLDARK